MMPRHNARLNVNPSIPSPPAPATGRRMCFEINGSLLLVIHGASPPADAEWDEFLAAMTGILDRHPPALVVTAGGGPTPAQRKRMNDLYKGMSPRTAVVCSSTRTLCIALAVGLFNPALRAFKATEMESAMAHVGIPQAVRRLARLRIDALYGEIGRASASSA